MQKREYVEPNVEFREFSKEDVLATSNKLSKFDNILIWDKQLWD